MRVIHVCSLNSLQLTIIFLVIPGQYKASSIMSNQPSIMAIFYLTMVALLFPNKSSNIIPQHDYTNERLLCLSRSCPSIFACLFENCIVPFHFLECLKRENQGSLVVLKPHENPMNTKSTITHISIHIISLPSL